jgi:hypothetical protein
MRITALTFAGILAICVAGPAFSQSSQEVRGSQFYRSTKQDDAQIRRSKEEDKGSQFYRASRHHKKKMHAVHAS